jgi:hypothetical protein
MPAGMDRSQALHELNQKSSAILPKIVARGVLTAWSSCTTSLVLRLWWRLALNCERDHAVAAHNHKPQGALLLLLLSCLATFGAFSRKTAEFLRIAQNNIHMLIKCHKFAHKLAPIIHRNAHPVIDILQNFARFCHTLRHPDQKSHAGLSRRGNLLVLKLLDANSSTRVVRDESRVYGRWLEARRTFLTLKQNPGSRLFLPSQKSKKDPWMPGLHNFFHIPVRFIRTL